MGMDTGVSFEMIRGIGVQGIGQIPALGIGLVELLILDIGMGRGR